MRRLLLLLGVLLLSCQDYRFAQQCPSSVKETQLMRPAVKATPADILFVVDNSGSMLDDQQRLVESFDRFIGKIAGRGDHRIAVITTDVRGLGEKEGASVGLFEQTYPFNAMYPDNADLRDCRVISPRIENGCFRGPNPEQRIVSTNSPTAKEELSANFVVGSCGSGDERGLEAMTRALSQMAPNGCNAGFLREEANLVVIFVSDENDHGKAEVGTYLDTLIAAKGGNARQVRTGVIVGSLDGQASACSPTLGASCGVSLCAATFPPSSFQSCLGGQACPAGEACTTRNDCQTPINIWRDSEPEACGLCSFFNSADCCSAQAGDRYVQFALGVENRVTQDDRSIPSSRCRPGDNERSACLIDTICQDNFGDTLERFATQLINREEYDLDPPAVNPSGVLVTVAGGRFGDGVTLEPGTDFVVSTDGKVLSFRDPSKAPTPESEETLDIYYASEVSQPGGGRGACATP